MVETYCVLKESDDGNGVQKTEIVEAMGNCPGCKTHAPETIDAWSTSSGLLGGSQNIFTMLGGDPAITSTEAKAQIRMPKCNVTGLNGYCYDASIDGTFTIRKNGVDTGITGTVDATGRFRFTGSVAFADGDLLSIHLSSTSGAGIGFNGFSVEASVELV